MTEYIDKRGWRFKVMHGLGEVWKARYNKVSPACAGMIPSFVM